MLSGAVIVMEGARRRSWSAAAIAEAMRRDEDLMARMGRTEVDTIDLYGKMLIDIKRRGERSRFTKDGGMFKLTRK